MAWLLDGDNGGANAPWQQVRDRNPEMTSSLLSQADSKVAASHKRREGGEYLFRPRQMWYFLPLCW